MRDQQITPADHRGRFKAPPQPSLWEDRTWAQSHTAQTVEKEFRRGEFPPSSVPNTDITERVTLIGAVLGRRQRQEDQELKTMLSDIKSLWLA